MILCEWYNCMAQLYEVIPPATWYDKYDKQFQFPPKYAGTVTEITQPLDNLHSQPR